MRIKNLLIITFLVIALSLTACTRAASRATGQAAGTGDELPFPVPETDGTPDVMGTLLAGGFATQTAIASSLEGGAQPDPIQVTPIPQETTEQQPAEQPPAQDTPTSEPPPPTEAPEPTKTPKSNNQDRTACSSPYTVNAGEWVYSIARKCGVEPEAIIAANGLRYPYSLFPGDKLTIPGGSAAADPAPPASTSGVCPSPYTVQPGEWVYAIARKCNVTPESIISLNGLLYPYSLYPGDTLRIP